MVDTSALVKYYHPEAGSSQVIAIADDPDNTLFISRIDFVEIHSALAARRYPDITLDNTCSVQLVVSTQ
jgi:uncharacterized protein with PIN domain